MLQRITSCEFSDIFRSHSMHHILCDLMIWAHSLDVIQPFRSSNYSNNMAKHMRLWYVLHWREWWPRRAFIFIQSRHSVSFLHTQRYGSRQRLRPKFSLQIFKHASIKRFDKTVQMRWLLAKAACWSNLYQNHMCWLIYFKHTQSTICSDWTDRSRKFHQTSLAKTL